MLTPYDHTDSIDYSKLCCCPEGESTCKDKEQIKIVMQHKPHKEVLFDIGLVDQMLHFFDRIIHSKGDS